MAKAINSILHEICELFFMDIDSAVVSFIGMVNAVSFFTIGLSGQEIIVDPEILLEHIDKVFNLLITILSFVILVRKYKNQSKK